MSETVNKPAISIQENYDIKHQTNWGGSNLDWCIHTNSICFFRMVNLYIFR